MTCDDYRLLLATRKCPRCQKMFEGKDMGMYSDYWGGWKIDDAAFRYTLYAYCSNCNTEVSFKDLGISEALTSMSQRVH